MNQRRLAGAIGHAQGAGAQARNGRDIDHCTAAAGQQKRHAGLGANKGTVQVAGHHGLPLGKCGVANGFKDGDARVVHQRVQPTPLVSNVLHSSVDRIGLTHIGVQRQHRAERRQAFGGGGQFGRVPVQQGHTVAVLQEVSGNGHANAPCGTRHQCDRVQ